MTSEVVPRVNQLVQVAVPKLCGGHSYNGEAEEAGRAEVYSSLPPSLETPVGRTEEKKKKAK
jgi:hypothetical protein